jgi:ribonuclease P protein component
MRFARRQRLTHAREFQAVYDAKLRKSLGPLIVSVKSNAGTHVRLGLAIGRRVGGAVVRVRLKRMLREAFRLMQHDLPRPTVVACGEPASAVVHNLGQYDVVIGAKPHEPLTLAEYSMLVRRLMEQAHAEHERRLARARPSPEPGDA